MCTQRAEGEASEFSPDVQLRELVDVHVLSAKGREVNSVLRLMSSQLKPGTWMGVGLWKEHIP